MDVEIKFNDIIPDSELKILKEMEYCRQGYIIKKWNGNIATFTKSDREKCINRTIELIDKLTKIYS